MRRRYGGLVPSGYGLKKGHVTLPDPSVVEAAKHLKVGEALVVDAGFDLATMLSLEKPFVIRLAKNATARRNYLPPYCGRGRHPEYGVTVRPLARAYNQRKTEATKPDKVAKWKDKGRSLVAHIWEGVVASDAKPGASTFRIIAIYDPRYPQPRPLARRAGGSCGKADARLRTRLCLWRGEPLPLAGTQSLVREYPVLSRGDDGSGGDGVLG